MEREALVPVGYSRAVPDTVGRSGRHASGKVKYMVGACTCSRGVGRNQSSNTTTRAEPGRTLVPEGCDPKLTQGTDKGVSSSCTQNWQNLEMARCSLVANWMKMYSIHVHTHTYMYAHHTRVIANI